MDFTMTFSKTLIPDDIRIAQEQLVRDEIAARSPYQAAEVLSEPDQLQLNLSTTKKS